MTARPTFRLLLAAAFAAAFPLSGCRSTSPAVGDDVAAPVAPAVHVPVTAEQYPRTFEATVEILRRANFRVDRQDFRLAVITTYPEGSPTIFEFWKLDNTTPHDALRSTLNDLRRTVTVTFEPDPAADAPDPMAPRPPVDQQPDRTLAVEVRLEGRQVPARRLDGRTSTGVFSDPAPDPDRDRLADPLEPYWQDLGRDPGLETELTRRILDRAQKTAP